MWTLREITTTYQFSQEQVVQGVVDMFAQAGAVVAGIRVRDQEFDNGVFPYMDIMLESVPECLPDGAFDPWEALDRRFGVKAIGVGGCIDDYSPILDWLLGSAKVAGEYGGVDFWKDWDAHYTFRLIVCHTREVRDTPILSIDPPNNTFVRPDGTSVRVGVGEFEEEDENDEDNK